MARISQLFIAIVAGLALNSCAAQEAPTHFEFSLAGDLVEKLEPKTIVTVSTLGTSKKKPCVFVSGQLEEFPLKLPVEDFRNRYTRVFFRSPTLKMVVFSMEMDGNLLDKPRPIKLLLNRPSTSLRTTSDWGTVRFTAGVSKRMRYLDLPYWDETAQKFIPMPNPPQLIYKIGDGPKRDLEMRGFCMDFKWFAQIPYDMAPKSDAKISYHATYNSGGAFELIESDFEYDFRADRH